MEINVILPLRMLFISILGYYFFLSDWWDVEPSARAAGLVWIREYFLLYLVANFAAGAAFIFRNPMRLSAIQFYVFLTGVLDACLMAILIFIVDGFDSPLYWVLLVLMVHNAVALPLALAQLLVNILVTIGYVIGGMLDWTLIVLPDARRALYDIRFEARMSRAEERTRDSADRVLLLIIFAACCYGISVLIAKQNEGEAKAARQPTGRAG